MAVSTSRNNDPDVCKKNSLKILSYLPSSPNITHRYRAPVTQGSREARKREKKHMPRSTGLTTTMHLATQGDPTGGDFDAEPWRTNSIMNQLEDPDCGIGDRDTAELDIRKKREEKKIYPLRYLNHYSIIIVRTVPRFFVITRLWRKEKIGLIHVKSYKVPPGVGPTMFHSSTPEEFLVRE